MTTVGIVIFYGLGFISGMLCAAALIRDTRRAGGGQ